MTFDTTADAAVTAKVGLSYVSAANAKANLAVESPGWDFDAVRQAAHTAWNKLLGRVLVAGGTADQQHVFYTALYHALQHPNVASDTNGEYLGFDNKTHTVSSGHSAQYATFSGWDIYRTQAQLEALVAPAVAADTAQSMLNDFAQSGTLPKWALNNGESYVMVGDPGAPTIADYYAFGARGFDTTTALADMVKEATVANNVRPGLNYLNSPGYLPQDGSYGCCNFYGSVSTLLEYNTADYAIAAFARSLGDTSTYAKFATRAQNWLNVLNPVSGMMQPRMASGAWDGGFTPTSDRGFVEGDSWQYTGMVPFNIGGLATAMGGTTEMRSYLDTKLSDLRGGSGHADLGNEPSLVLPWEYDYVGQPYKTQQLVRKVQDEIWSNRSGGLAGNDDLGTMSSWFVWSALGMYPATPGTSTLALGSPLFEQAKLTLPSGNTLTINGDGAADNAPYVQSLKFNGAAWNNAYAPDTAITAGGTLDYTLGSSANTSWASAGTAAPPSDLTGSPTASVYATPDGTGVVVPPGEQGQATLHITNLSDSSQTISWRASAPPGVTLTPTSGTVPVAARASATATVTVKAGQVEGSFPVTITPTTTSGTALAAAALTVSVARAGGLWPYFTNAGVGQDGTSNTASFDRVGYSYSEAALAAAGVKPGGQVTTNGLTFTWPNASANLLDNIEADGQTIAITSPAGATRIGVLGASSNPSGSVPAGTLGITYTDGTTQQATLGLSDWTLNAGQSQALSGNHVAATMPYRDGTDGSKQQVAVYLFTADTALSAGKTVASITLPTVSAGALHIFSVGFDVAGADPVTITNPGAQNGTVGAATTLRLRASDAVAGQTLTYSASGLPPGVSFDATTGVISGIPTAAGTNTVRVSAADGAGRVASAAFAWTVVPGPITGFDGRCIDDPSQSTTSGTQLQMYNCNQTPAQQWTVGADGALQVLGTCMAIDGDGATTGTAVVISTCAGTEAQTWQPQADGTLRNLASGKCLDDPNFGGETTKLDIATCTGAANQQWRLPSGPQRIFVTNPGDQDTVRGSSVNLQIQASTTAGLPLTYQASGLPVGMSIDAGTGRVTGAPTSAGSGKVTVTATDSAGNTGGTSFTWMVDISVGAITAANGQCIDDPSGSTTNGNRLQMWDCRQSPAQTWTVGGDGTLRVVGKCMTVDGAGTADGTAVVLYDCGPTAAQVWQAHNDGTLRNPASGKCLEDPGSGGITTKLDITTCDPSAADQHWRLP